MNKKNFTWEELKYHHIENMKNPEYRKAVEIVRKSIEEEFDKEILKELKKYAK